MVGLRRVPDPQRRPILRAESADWTIVAQGTFTGFALAYLVARAFSSGTTALTGIEAISNGVPAFRKPKSRNAATTLLAARGHRDVDVQPRSPGSPSTPACR